MKALKKTNGKPLKYAIHDHPQRVEVEPTKKPTKRQKQMSQAEIIRGYLNTLGVTKNGMAPNTFVATGLTDGGIQTIWNIMAKMKNQPGGKAFSSKTTREPGGTKSLKVWRIDKRTATRKKPRSTARATANTAPSVTTETGENTNGNRNASYLPLQDAFGLL